MTSGSFETVPLDSIIIDRTVRQRRDLENVPELADSISRLGLIHPPVVTRELVLVAGERRTEACRLLGWSAIPIQYADTLDPVELHLLELEENVKRTALSWTDENDAIAAYHELRSRSDPEWNQTKTSEALGISRSSIVQHLAVKEERKKNPEVEKQEKFSTARNMAARAQARRTASVLSEIAGVTDNSRPVQLLNVDFFDWLAAPSGLFNLIHCDFPYGVSTGDKRGQSAAKSMGTYEDSADIYWTLLRTFLARQDDFIAPSAHLIFWFSMKYFVETKAMLEAAGWTVNYMPFIWSKSDNTGIIPDPQRGPRYVYETALFASRGDRLVVRPLANLFHGPTTKQYHTSEKSFAMLSHFFSMLVDETSRVFDPTCGSGMAIKAAEACGANFALGLERDLDFFRGACDNLGYGSDTGSQDHTGVLDD